MGEHGESIGGATESNNSPCCDNYPRIDMGYCVIDDLNQQQVFDWLRETNTTGSYGYIVTPNIDHIQRLYLLDEQSELVAIYRNAALSLCDSRILKKVMTITGFGRPNVVTGSGLTAALFANFFTPRDRIGVIGGDKKLISRLRSLYPNFHIRHFNPPMGFIHRPAEVDEVVKFCNEMNFDYIFLAVGSPQQELVAARLKNSLSHGVAMCVGASLHFIVGEERRAPVWVQKISCEWLYRLLMNPRRLAKRYLMNSLHLARIARNLHARKRAQQGLPV